MEQTFKAASIYLEKRMDGHGEGRGDPSLKAQDENAMLRDTPCVYSTSWHRVEFISCIALEAWHRTLGNLANRQYLDVVLDRIDFAEIQPGHMIQFLVWRYRGYFQGLFSHGGLAGAELGLGALHMDHGMLGCIHARFGDPLATVCAYGAIGMGISMVDV